MRKIRRSFKRPRMPWSAAEINENKKLAKEYGLRRKKEIWITEQILRDFRRRARDLIATKNKEEEKILLEKLVKLGLLEEKKGLGLDDVLALTVRHILNRRLQSVVFKIGLADSIKQARQYIVHGHIAVDGRKTVYPSYLVTAEEEKKIDLYPGSKLKGG